MTYMNTEMAAEIIRDQFRRWVQVVGIEPVEEAGEMEFKSEKRQVTMPVTTLRVHVRRVFAYLPPIKFLFMRVDKSGVPDILSVPQVRYEANASVDILIIDVADRDYLYSLAHLLEVQMQASFDEFVQNQLLPLDTKR